MVVAGLSDRYPDMPVRVAVKSSNTEANEEQYDSPHYILRAEEMTCSTSFTRFKKWKEDVKENHDSHKSFIPLKKVDDKIFS